MPTYYPQDAADAVMTALVVLAALIALVSWLAGLYDLHNPLPYDDGEFREIPDQAGIAAQHCDKVHAKRAAADLARGTSDNLGAKP